MNILDIPRIRANIHNINLFVTVIVFNYISYTIQAQFVTYGFGSSEFIPKNILILNNQFFLVTLS